MLLSLGHTDLVIDGRERLEILRRHGSVTGLTVDIEIDQVLITALEAAGTLAIGGGKLLGRVLKRSVW